METRVKPGPRRRRREVHDTSVQPGRRGAGGAAGPHWCAELGTEHGTVHRGDAQLGHGTGSFRWWVKQADVDHGRSPGGRHGQAAHVRALEQENRELCRAPEILKWLRLHSRWSSTTSSPRDRLRPGRNPIARTSIRPGAVPRPFQRCICNATSRRFV